MKKTILLMTIIVVAFLLVPILSFSQPENYLTSEGSSYGLKLSKEAKKEASQARADRLLLYQDEIDMVDLDDLELQATEDSSSVSDPGSNPKAPDIDPGCAGQKCEDAGHHPEAEKVKGE